MSRFVPLDFYDKSAIERIDSGLDTCQPNNVPLVGIGICWRTRAGPSHFLE